MWSDVVRQEVLQQIRDAIVMQRILVVTAVAPRTLEWHTWHIRIWQQSQAVRPAQRCLDRVALVLDIVGMQHLVCHGANLRRRQVDCIHMRDERL